MGGLGLFLLGMGLMTEGLKLAAGGALERILGVWTRTRARGLAAGMLITAVLQSSSAITLATIGFVNAGLLTLSQAVWVLFGANVGTTMTGWLVAIVGFKLQIEAFAMPLLGLGMILRLAGEGRRLGAFGTAAAGFGALFLGIDVLRRSFTGLGAELDLDGFEGYGAFAVVAYIAIGVLLTTLMQSSSAALAITLTAAGGGLIGVQSAAAVVIGANVGTTVTALLAAIGATANARRAAGAHVLFNVLTAFVAVLLLPWMLGWTEAVGRWLELDPAPATTLALFHTTFNVLGVVLMWPLSDRLVDFLQARFRSADEAEGRPRHLDPNTTAVPTLALDALVMELRHLGSIALRMARSAMTAPADAQPSVARDKAAVDRLTIAIGEFTARLNRSAMAQESSERLPEILRVARYYDAVADLATQIADQRAPMGAIPAAIAAELEEFKGKSVQLFALADTDRLDFDVVACQATLTDLEGTYQGVKARLLRAGAAGELRVTDMEGLLQVASLVRRSAQQAVKAAQRLHAIDSGSVGAARRLDLARGENAGPGSSGT